jgi:hypothetical protein
MALLRGQRTFRANRADGNCAENFTLLGGAISLSTASFRGRSHRCEKAQNSIATMQKEILRAEKFSAESGQNRGMFFALL